MQWICLKPKARAMQGNPNPESGILEVLVEEFGILGFGIRNPRLRIQNPGLSCIPLNGATEKAMLSPQISRNWNSLIFGQRYLAMKVAFGETLISRGTQRQFSVKYLFGEPKIA